MTRILIVEDEEPAASRLARLLTRIDPGIEIAGTADTIDSAVDWIRTNPKPDLIMLDIQLGDGLSFEIFRKTDIESYVIFTTAYDEYAIRAFELNSIDYLLKPIDETRLSHSLEKFRKFRSFTPQVNIAELMEAMEKKNDRYKKRFIVNISNRIRVIDIADVAYFFTREKNTFLCTHSNRNYPLEFSLDQLEEIVNPEVFFRVSRQYLVSFKSILKIHVLSHSRIMIELSPVPPDEVLVSTARTPEFRKWLDK